MEIDDAIAFIRTNHRAVLATTTASGRTALSPVVIAAADDGTLLLSTRETAMKTTHIARSGRASYVVMNDGFFGQYVQVEGPTTVTPMPEALDDLVTCYRLIAGEHPNWTEYAEKMSEERRVIIKTTVDYAGPNRRG